MKSLNQYPPYNPPNMQSLPGYAVNREGQYEVIWQPTYDIQAYGTAGATQFTFFQRSVGSSSTTLADTNMRAAGQFPNPQKFLVTGIQVMFDAGNTVSAGDVTTATAAENWNDVNDVLFGSGYLELVIGSKPYLQDAPLAKFPQQFRLTGVVDSSDSSTAGADQKGLTDYAVGCGKYYAITPLMIPTNQNFSVTLNFPSAIAIASAARIGVILDGFLYRLSQ